jgi:hypothetical protein
MSVLLSVKRAKALEIIDKIPVLERLQIFIWGHYLLGNIEFN